MFEGGEIFVGEASGWINPVEEGAAAMVGPDPIPVGGGDFVVDPGEGAAGSPCHQWLGFPVEAEPSILAFACVR